MYNSWQAMGQYTAHGMFPQQMMGMVPGQQMYQWYYNQWQPQQAYPMAPQLYPPIPDDGSTVKPPAPPVEPPAEVKPPLPPEPPPDDPDKMAQPQPPTAPAQQQQPPGARPHWQQQQPPPPPPPAEDVPAKSLDPHLAILGPDDAASEDPIVRAELDDVLKLEDEFNSQYQQWKQQYQDWQELNKNHPNKDQFDQYLAQWKQYEQQMETRSRDIREKKNALEEKLKGGGQLRESNAKGTSVAMRNTGPETGHVNSSQSGQGQEEFPVLQGPSQNQQYSTGTFQSGIHPPGPGGQGPRPPGPGGQGPWPQGPGGLAGPRPQGPRLLGPVGQGPRHPGPGPWSSGPGSFPPRVQGQDERFLDAQHNEGQCFGSRFPGSQGQQPHPRKQSEAEGGEDDMELDDFQGEGQILQDSLDNFAPSNFASQPRFSGFPGQRGSNFNAPGYQNFQAPGSGNFRGGAGPRMGEPGGPVGMRPPLRQDFNQVDGEEIGDEYQENENDIQSQFQMGNRGGHRGGPRGGAVGRGDHSFDSEAWTDVGPVGRGFGPAGRGEGQFGRGFGHAGRGLDPASRGLGPTGRGLGPGGRGFGPGGRGLGSAGRGFGPTGRGGLDGQAGRGFGSAENIDEMDYGFGEDTNEFGFGRGQGIRRGGGFEKQRGQGGPPFRGRGGFNNNFENQEYSECDYEEKGNFDTEQNYTQEGPSSMGQGQHRTGGFSRGRGRVGPLGSVPVELSKFPRQRRDNNIGDEEDNWQENEDVAQDDSVYGSTEEGGEVIGNFPPPGRFPSRGAPAGRDLGNRFGGPARGRFATPGNFPPSRMEGPRDPGGMRNGPRFAPPHRGGPGGTGQFGPRGRGAFDGRPRGPQPLMSVVFDELTMEQKLGLADQSSGGSSVDRNFEERKTPFGNMSADAMLTEGGDVDNRRIPHFNPASATSSRQPFRNQQADYEEEAEQEDVGAGQGSRPEADLRKGGPQQKEGKTEHLPKDWAHDQAPIRDSEQLLHREQGQTPFQPLLRDSAPGQRQDSGPPLHRGPGQPPLRDPGPSHPSLLREPGGQPQLRDSGPPQLIRDTGPPQLRDSGPSQLRDSGPSQFRESGQPSLRDPDQPQLQDPGQTTPRDSFFGDFPRQPDTDRRDPYFNRRGSDSYYERFRNEPFFDRSRMLPEGFAGDRWAREREPGAGKMEKLFVPAESIDYGHGQGRGLGETASKPQVIDYGHGNKAGDGTDKDAFRDNWQDERGPLFDNTKPDVDRRSLYNRDSEVLGSRLEEPVGGRNDRWESGFGDDRSRWRSEYGSQQDEFGRRDFLNSGGSDSGKFITDRSGRLGRQDELERSRDGRAFFGHSDWPERGERSDVERFGRIDRRDWGDSLSRPNREHDANSDWTESGSRGRNEFLDRGRLDFLERNRGDIFERGRDDFPERGRSDFPERGRGDFPERGRSDFIERGRNELVERVLTDFPDDNRSSFTDRGRGLFTERGRNDFPERFGDFSERDRHRLPEREPEDYLGRDRDEISEKFRSDISERGQTDFGGRGDFPDRSNRNIDGGRYSERDRFDAVDHGDRSSDWPDVRHREADRNRDAGRPKERSPADFPPAAPPSVVPTLQTFKVEDLLCPPARKSRPAQLVIIVRGLPGSGKTYASKLLREKEIANGGSAPRMLSLDDYFMVEQEKKAVDPETGKKVTSKVLEYEYEQAMEDVYRQNLFKSFKKTVDDGFFPFIIVDAINEKVSHFEEFWSYAKSKGFQVYVAEKEADIPTCINQNIHKWTEYDIEKVKGRWEATPPHFIRLDIRWLLQNDSITEVEMEDAAPAETQKEAVTSSGEEKRKHEDEEEEEEGVRTGR